MIMPFCLSAERFFLFPNVPGACIVDERSFNSYYNGRFTKEKKGDWQHDYDLRREENLSI